MTSDMTRNRYLNQLTQLHGEAQTVASVNKLKKYCPHLNDEQITNLMEQASRNLEITFSVPAVTVKKSYHILKLSSVQRFIPGTRRRMQETRCLKYLNFQGKDSPDDLFSKEAITFSNANWVRNLVEDNWEEIQEIRVLNPYTLELENRAYCVLNRPWKDVIYDSLGEPEQCWSDAINLFSFNSIEGKELRGKRDVYIEEHCSECGTGLSQTSCLVCDVSFEKLKYGSWGLEMPELIAKFL